MFSDSQLLTTAYVFFNEQRCDVSGLSKVELIDQPPVAGGWRKIKPPKNAKRVTHPVPQTPKRFRG